MLWSPATTTELFLSRNVTPQEESFQVDETTLGSGECLVRQLSRLQHQAVLFHLCDCFLGEVQREGCAFVPGLPLIHVVGAEQVTGLASDGIQGGLVEVGEIGSVAFGGTEGAAHLLDGETAAGLVVLPKYWICQLWNGVSAVM